MHRKPFSVLRHAAAMVWRTIKCYALLSVTIVLSFSLLLGYLLYTDSSLYNQHKNRFSQRRGDVVVTAHPLDLNKTNVFLNNLKDIDGTVAYAAYYALFGQSAMYYESDAYDKSQPLGNMQALLVPDYAWLDTLTEHFDDPSELVWVGGRNRDEFVLEADEIILGEELYLALELDKEENPVFHLRNLDGINLYLRVAGYIRMEETDLYATYSRTPMMYLSTKLLDQVDLLSSEFIIYDQFALIDRQIVVIHSEHPEEVVLLAKTMGYEAVDSVYELQNEALEAIRYEKKNKAIISMALLVLLGINLYSSFTNALNDRKFEIGVKRAIGASAFSIVRQFLYESLIVMAANIFISVVLVTDVFIVYKYIYEHTPTESGIYPDWTLYISPHSIAMFAVCSLSLTIVFSLIFAYKSTRVEIVQYLKAE